MTHLPIPPAELEAMKARCENATAGPWQHEQYSLGPLESPGKLYFDQQQEPFAEIHTVNSDADICFIAHARTDLPRCISEIERLTKLDNYELGYREGESSAVADYQLALDGLMEGDCLPSEVSREIARLRSDLEVARHLLRPAEEGGLHIAVNLAGVPNADQVRRIIEAAASGLEIQKEVALSIFPKPQ